MSRRRYKSKNSQQPQQPASTIGTCFASAASSPFGASTGFGQSTAAALAPGALFGTAATSFGGAPTPPTGFGGAPTPPAGFGGAPAPPASAADHKYRLQLFYQQRDPTKMNNVGQILAKYQGREGQLFASLANKYNVVVPAHGASQPAAAPGAAAAAAAPLGVVPLDVTFGPVQPIAFVQPTAQVPLFAPAPPAPPAPAPANGAGGMGDLNGKWKVSGAGSTYGPFEYETDFVIGADGSTFSRTATWPDGSAMQPAMTSRGRITKAPDQGLSVLFEDYSGPVLLNYSTATIKRAAGGAWEMAGRWQRADNSDSGTFTATKPGFAAHPVAANSPFAPHAVAPAPPPAALPAAPLFTFPKGAAVPAPGGGGFPAQAAAPVPQFNFNSPGGVGGAAFGFPAAPAPGVSLFGSPAAFPRGVQHAMQAPAMA